MPSCIECEATPANTLYVEYGKDNIVLTQCDRCGKVVDKYVEHDFVIIFIDMVLHKPQVYRHLLFNRIEYRDSGLNPFVFRLGIVWIFFDIYIIHKQPISFLIVDSLEGKVCFDKLCEFAETIIASVIRWYRLQSRLEENPLVAEMSPSDTAERIFTIVIICVLETVAFHLFVRNAVSWYLGDRYAIVKYNYVSTALIISSFGKLIIVLMVIWEFDNFWYSWLVSVVVFTSNAQALSVFLNSGFMVAVVMVFFGAVGKALLQTAAGYVDPSIPTLIF